MTTIITRLYSDRSAADAAKNALLGIGQDEDTIRIINAENGDAALAAMLAARVNSHAAKTYLKAMTGSEVLLVVAAPFNPIGTARNAIKALRKHASLDVGLEDEDVYLRAYPDAQYANKVMKKHPLVLSNPFRRLSHGHIFGSNPILPGKDRTSAIRGGAFMSQKFWPMKLVSSPRHSTSAIRGGRLFSALFGLPLLTTRWVSREDLPTIIR